MRYSKDIPRDTLAGVADTARSDTDKRRLPPHDDAVLAALRGTANHPTAGELYDIVRQRYPHMGRATVYRALQRLEAAGLAVEVGRDSLGRHYDARTERHDHAICTACGRVLDILPPDELPRELLAGLESLARTAGVAVDTYEIRLYGLCTACQEAATAAAHTQSAHDQHQRVRRGDTDE